MEKKFFFAFLAGKNSRPEPLRGGGGGRFSKCCSLVSIGRTRFVEKRLLYQICQNQGKRDSKI